MLSLRVMISWERLPVYSQMVEKSSQVLGYLAILEPIVVTWNNGVIRFPRPGSWASRGGITRSGPPEQHGTVVQIGKRVL